MALRSKTSLPTRLAVAGLLALCVVPVAAGLFRLYVLAFGEVTPDNARFFASPVSVVVHIISVSLFGVLGAFQFVPSLRKGAGNWHRRVGPVVWVMGLLAALSGLWMTLFYPWAPNDNWLLYVFRLAVGTWMLFSLTIAYLRVRQRDFSEHEAFMLRGYAIGMGAGTQAAVFIPFELSFGHPDILGRALLMGFAWALNFVFAEWLLWRRGRAKALPTLLSPERAGGR